MESAVHIPENKEHMLPSEKIYKEYNKSIVNLDNNSKCENLTREIPEFPDINKLCHRLTMNIKNFNTKEKDDFSVIDDCKYLQYWMNDSVINELKVTNNDKYIDIIKKLYIAWIEIKGTLDGSKYICEPIGGPLISLRINEFKFRKDMYDYYYNAKKIPNRELCNIDGCCEICKYLTSIKEKYDNFKSQCYSTSINKCVSDFKKFDEYDPIKLSNLLGCQKQSDCDKVDVLVLDKSLEETRLDEDSTKDEKLEKDTQGSTENSNSRTILNVALPASVFFVLFPMLYKMTPLGSRFGKANKIRNNIINDLKNEEGEHFLTHAFEQESMNNSDRTYNISYNNT